MSGFLTPNLVFTSDNESNKTVFKLEVNHYSKHNLGTCKIYYPETPQINNQLA